MLYANDLIIFSQVANLGSFKRVAELNNLTNSAVSKRISQLEQRLNAQLLYRSTRKLALTDSGKRLLEYANSIQQVTHEAIQDIVNDNDNIQGHIKMSVPTISGELIIAEAVASFCNNHDHITIDISLENKFVNPIEDGYDLVIRTGLLEDSSLIARHLIKSEWVICATSEYFDKYGKPNQIYDLLNHNCLRYAYHADGPSNWLFNSQGQSINLQVNGSLITDNASALQKAALANHGIIHVPRCLVYENIVAGNLVTIFDQQIAKKLGVYAIHPFTKKTPKKISQLIEHLRLAFVSKRDYYYSQ